MKKQKKYIRDVLTLLKGAMHLSDYNIQIQYMDEDKSEPVAAAMRARPHYRIATLCIYPGFWNEEEESKKRILIHELCHIYTQKTRDMWLRMANGTLVTEDEQHTINEEITTMMAILAEDTLLAGLKDISYESNE